MEKEQNSTKVTGKRSNLEQARRDSSMGRNFDSRRATLAPGEGTEVPRGSKTPIELVRVEYETLRKKFSRGDLLKEGWVPDRYRELHMRVLTGHCSKSQRIKLQCAECFGWQNVREEVRNCEVMTCHLWGARPYQTKKTKKLSEK